MSNPTALKGQSPEGPEPRGYALQSLRLVLGILTPIVIGLLLGYGLLTQVILKNFGLGRVQRIVEVGRHLDNAQYPEQWLVFIGNSIVRDGIDGAIVSEASGASIPAENLASSGADLNEHRIFLPKLLSRKPTAVVLAFVPSTACGRGTIALDKAYAYAHAGFVKAWPDYIDEDYLPGVGAEAYEALLATPFEQNLHLRTMLPTALDSYLRFVARKDLRMEYATDSSALTSTSPRLAASCSRTTSMQ